MRTFPTTGNIVLMTNLDPVGSARERSIEAARQAIRHGRLNAAKAIAAEILASNPLDVDALEIRALVEMEAGADAAAEQSLRLAIAVAPERRWPYGDLTRLLVKLGRTSDAECIAAQALEADPQNADALAMLGSLLADRERWVEASGYFEQALALVGPHPQLLQGLGQALLRQGRLEDARPMLESAVAANPETLEPLVHLAEAEERLGLFGDARRHLDRAESIARRLGTDVDLQRSVLLVRTGSIEDALELLEGRDDLSGAALLQRGRLRELLGRYREAWSDWVRGKAKLAKDRGRRYAADTVQAKALRLADFFSSAAAAELQRPQGRPDVIRPIFIVGFPRSGTTLVEQILASHSRIAAGGELPFGADLCDFATVLAGGESSFPHTLAKLHPDVPIRLRDFYLEKAGKYGLLGTDRAYFTDKMPDNAFWLPLLRLAFPHSPVILVRRDPLDVLTSVMAHDMTHGFDCAYRLEDAAFHLALVDRLVETYRLSDLGPTHVLRYEVLVKDQQGETERLMQVIRLELEPAQLEFHRRAEVSPTPSYAQVRQPLNDRSIGRWRNFADELKPVRPLVAEARVRGGYAG